MFNRIALKCLTLILLISLGFNFAVKAQFGNEWINPLQKYVKIKVSAEGLYVINFTQISQAGLTSSTLDPKKFQLFNKGKQVALMVSGNQNTFENTDKITFYGQPNDASLDKKLYTIPTDLPNPEVSLFDDSNYYFLTYNETQNGLRYQNPALSNVGLTPENYLVYASRLNFASTYYPGRFILASMSLSEYIAGEGYLGTTYGKGESQNYTLNTPNFANNTNLPTTSSFYVAGRSDSNLGISNSENHHFKITINNITITDTVFRSYDIVKHQKNTSLGILPATTGAVFSSVDDLSATPNFTDFQAPSYIEIKYPRLLNLSGINDLKFSLNTTQTNAYLKFTNSNIANPIILDNSNNAYYSETKNAAFSEFVIATNVNNQYFLTDLNTTLPTTLEPVVFKNFNASTSKPFLIISNKLFTAGADAYKTYNENSRNLPSTIAYVEDLYNEFYFGFHHPLAIKNFVAYSLSKATPANKPTYLLLLGNGSEYPKNNTAIDFVPTIGFPPSDNMLTSGLNGSILEPGLLTGRLPVINNNQITNYLEKLTTYNLLPDSLWRKNFIHVSGGTSSSENNSWANFQNTFFTYAKQTSFGGKVSIIKKNVGAPITENQTERIINETNKGIGLLSYFGHGASTATEISLGEPNKYNNKNKTPFYIINGCSTGDVFAESNSLAEQFLLEKDLGGLAWIGTTSLGVASYLFNATNIFYKNWFQESYGEPVTKGIQKGLREFQQNSDNLNLAHVRQYIFVGDPALKFYAPAKADYEIKNSFLFPTVANQDANFASLSLKLKIENPGKAIADSVVVKITRTLPDNSVIEIPNYKIKPVYNTDTIAIELNNSGILAAGNNKITVILDPENKIPELNENNNQATIDIFLAGNGINLLYPINNGIVSSSTITLEAQTDNLYTKNAEYIFEIDTLISFNSSFYKSSGVFNSGLLPKWQPPVTFEVAKVYYWRARLNLPIDNGGAWSTASFTYLPNIVDGVNFSHKSQLQNLTFKNITFDSNSGKFDFTNTMFLTNIQTRGDDATNATERRIRVNPNSQIAFRAEFNGISLVSLNPKVFGEIFSYPSPYNFNLGPNLINGYSGQYFWDITDPVQVDSLVRYIKQIPKGYYVMGLNGYNAAINSLPSNVKNELSTLGLDKFNLINLGDPYLFYGIKDSAPGTALEVTADYNSIVPPRSQLISLANTYLYKQNNGYIISEKIGPAKTWKNSEFDFYTNGADNLKYSIIGVNPAGIETILNNNITANQLDINNISATTYPYLKIKTDIVDIVDNTVPDLKHLKIVYQPVSELTFNPEFKDIFKALTIQEGDSTKWEIGVTNLSNYESEPMNIVASIFKADKTTLTKPIINIPKLLPKTSFNLKLNDATKGLGGKNNYKLQFQTKNEFDLYSFNNTLTKDYTVNKDVKEPLVNIIFDGKTIINGEIVSPKPVINITTIDENKFMLLGDTAFVEVYIKNQNSNQFTRLWYSNSQLKIKPATNNSATNKSTIEYITKTPFDDGVYTLKVRSKDASGNYNTNNDYTIDFESINKSEISNFYPYPNPCTTSMRFVFTLTGMKIPDDIKITIFTATGKVVREVFKNELGNIKPGNNISDFAWDGTDQFGDRLANGIYFYNVVIKNYDDAQIGRRATNGDNLFKKNIGKIYLLR